MPELRAREQSVRAERQAILDQAADQISFLRLAETLTAFLQRLRQSAETLEIAERQKVVRLLVLCFRNNVAKEVTLPRRFCSARCGRPDRD
jgi:uncharacterized protein YerC